MTCESRRALLLLVATLAAAGCRRLAPTGSLRVALCVGEARTLVPEGDYTPQDYVLEGEGPSAQAFSITLSQASTDVTDLTVGTWTITATARNTAGEPVAAGQTTAEVAPEEVTPVAIALGALPGQGHLELTVLWTPQTAPSPVLDVELLDAQAASCTVDTVLSAEPGQATASATGLPSGWYTLLVRLSSDETLVAGLAEAVLIRAAATTQGTLDLRGIASAGVGGMSVTLTLDLPATDTVLLAGQHAAMIPDQVECLETYPPPTSWQGWFLDGQMLGTGGACTLTAPGALGQHRLDAVRISGACASRSGYAFQVRASVVPGTLTRAFDLAEGDWGIRGIRGTRAAVVSPDGQWLYATGYETDSVAVFHRNPQTGLLWYAGEVAQGGAVQGLDGAEGLVMDAEGLHLYVAGYTADALSVFRRQADGLLEQIACYGGLDGIRAVALSPDGRHVYAALAAADAVALLERDTATGLLTHTATFTNGQDGIATLLAPTDLTVSGDGLHLYVTAYSGDSVLWFLRDPESGGLSLLGETRDGQGGADGLNGAHGIALSLDGQCVYVASYYDDALVVLHRDVQTGALTPVELHTDGEDGVDGLAYARDVAVGVDAVYVAGGGDDRVAVFRQQAEGGLVFQECLDVPDGPRGLALCADGSSLYVCSSGASSITLLCLSP